MIHLPRTGPDWHHRLRWALLTAVLAILPATLLHHAGERALATRREAMLERQRLRLEEVHGFVQSQLSDEPLVERLRRLQRHFEHRYWRITLRRAITRLRRDYPGALEFLVLDGRGGAVPELSDLRLPTDVIASLHEDLLRYQAEPGLGVASSLVRNANRYRPWLGINFVRHAPGSFFDGFQDASPENRRHHIFVSRPTANGYLVVLKSNTVWRTECGTAILLRHLRRRLPDLLLGAVDRRRIPDRHAGFGEQARHLERVLAELGSSSGEVLTHDGHGWTQLLLTPNRYLVFALGDPEAHARVLLARRLTLGAWLLAVGGAWLIWRQSGPRPLMRMSLRLQLGLLFAFAVGLPLGLLTMVADDRRRDRERLEIERHHERVERMLGRYDREFDDWLGHLAERTRTALHPPRPVPPPQRLALAVAELTALVRAFRQTKAGVYDDSGRNLAPDLPHDDTSTFLQPLVPLLLQRINVGRTRQGGNFQAELFGATSESFGIDVDRTLAFWERNFGKIEEIQIANERMYLGMTPMFEADGSAGMIVITAWRRFELPTRYLDDTLAGFTRQIVGDTGNMPSRADRHLAELAGVFCQFPPGQRSRPKGFAHQDWVRRLLPVIQRTGLPVHRQAVRRGTGWLLTGIRCQSLRELHLFAVLPDLTTRARLDRLQRDFLLLVGSLLLAATAAGGLLLDRILSPIGRLGEGIAAIRRRDFGHVIPSPGADELGALTVTFNRMVAGLGELEVARTLAERFYPASPLTVGGWTVFGSCRSASRVGGDFYSYHRLDDGRLAFSVGDVSGHGTGAALVVAMVRALTTLLERVDHPEAMLTRLHQTLFPLLKRRKMMSLVTAVFAPAGGRLTVANAGHQYPLLLRRGVVSELETRGMPVASRRVLQVTPLTADLEPGDALFLYTDGFVEAMRPDGAMIGYDAMREALPALLGPDPVATERALRQWHAARVRPGPADDDITLLILQGN